MEPKTGMEVGTDNWATPRWFLDLLFDGEEFFDPCPLNPSPDVDGLAVEWPTNMPVFINPPYSNPGPWTRKARDHKGPVVLLLRCDPATTWWQESVSAFRVTLIGQRLRFGTATRAAPFPSALWRKP